MALDKSHTLDFTGLALQCTEIKNAAGEVVAPLGTQATAIVHLTDSSGGATGNDTLAAMVTQAALTDNTAGTTADGTIAAITDLALSTSGGNTYSDSAVNTGVNAKIVLVRDAVTELSTKLNLHTTAINTSRDNLADLAAKVNAILSALETAGVIAT